MSATRIRLHDDVVNRVRDLAQAIHRPAALLVNDLLRHHLNGGNGKTEVAVHHFHEARSNPEFRAKLIKGQRGSYGFELTVADTELATVLQQLDRFQHEMEQRYSEAEDDTARKVRQDVTALFGEEPAFPR